MSSEKSVYEAQLPVKYRWWLTRPTVTSADPVFQPTSEN